MMKQLIQKWLDGPQNFIHGRVLFNQFGKDESLKKLFAAGETVESADKLLEALQALAKCGSFTAVVIETAVDKKTNVTEEMMLGNDAVEEAIQKDWKAHYTNMNQLRGQLDAYGSDNSPKTIAACNNICADILREERYINYCWEKLDYYRIHGKLPEDKEDDIVIPDDPVKLAKFIQAVTRNIRRNKQLSRENENNPTYPALVIKYESILNKITAKKD